MAEAKQTAPRMTAEAFMAWYELQPAGRRYELLDGLAYEMQGERLAHGRAKADVYVAFRRMISQRQLPCEAIQDGMAVRIDDDTVFEPDAMVRCGPALPGDAVVIVDPIIVVEVLSPTTQHVDVVRKFTGYFRNPSIAHYLIVNVIDRNIVHHRRTGDGRIESSSHAQGVILLDPPGLSLDWKDIFGGEASE